MLYVGKFYGDIVIEIKLQTAKKCFCTDDKWMWLAFAIAVYVEYKQANYAFTVSYTWIYDCLRSSKI